MAHSGQSGGSAGSVGLLGGSPTSTSFGPGGGGGASSALGGSGSGAGFAAGPGPAPTDILESFEGFVLERVLQDDPASKSLACLGHFEGLPGQAIVSLAKRHFASGEELQRLLSGATRLMQPPMMRNDVYSKYECIPPAFMGSINADLIYPAAPKHLAKYASQKLQLVAETPALYAAVTRPYIEAQPPASLQWVYNILEGREEAERVICADPEPETGFVLMIDQKWDQADLAGLYCLALVRRRDLRSLRCLTAEHLPLLRSLRHKCLSALAARYGILADSVRCFLHVPPSYYHLHVHFVHVGQAHQGMAVGRAHLLEDVIDNLSLSPDYYQRRTLLCAFPDADPLLAALRARALEEAFGEADVFDL